MKKIPIKKLNNDKLIYIASQLNTSGYLTTTSENFTYLDIDDHYIHQLFPLLEDGTIKKPDYFDESSIGAHISVIYPEENKPVEQEDLGIKHHFIVKGIYTAKLNSKRYYILTVDSPSLFQLRKKYDLPDLLCFKNHWIEFHITIGYAYE